MTDRRRIKREREAQVNVLLFAFLEPIRLQDCSPIKALTLPRKTALKIQKKKTKKNSELNGMSRFTLLYRIMRALHFPD